MLTRKQQELLKFIQSRLDQDGVSPSFDEMKEALDLKSKSGIHRLVTALEERGFIRRLANRARALEIVKAPQDNVPVARKPAAQPVLAKSSNIAPPSPANDLVEIPLHGKIAAGTPIEAIENAGSHIPVAASMLGHGQHYALEVSGDSMVEAGILDGDLVLIEQVNTARDGEIVVALIDNEEATLKTIRRKEGRVLLLPANRDYETQVFTPDRVRIQGRLVGLMRRYH